MHLGGATEGLAEDAALVEAGKTAFEDEDCTSCHNDPSLSVDHEDYDATVEGPDLAGYQSFEWIRGLIRDVHAPHRFGGAVAPSDRERMMPAYPDLSDGELRLLVRWLQAGAPEADAMPEVAPDPPAASAPAETEADAAAETDPDAAQAPPDDAGPAPDVTLPAPD
jgi:hypothetical protein